jgi:hypothetical protein
VLNKPSVIQSITHYSLPLGVRFPEDSMTIWGQITAAPHCVCTALPTHFKCFRGNIKCS